MSFDVIQITFVTAGATRKQRRVNGAVVFGQSAIATIAPTVIMAVTAEYGQIGSSNAYAPLEGRFEVIKEIGDGSFGNVVLARVRAAGAHVARRGTMVLFYFESAFFLS